MTDQQIIEELGGVYKLAKTVGISQPAASYWKRKGIPPLRKIQLKVLFPEKAHLFDETRTIQPKAETSGD